MSVGRTRILLLTGVVLIASAGGGSLLLSRGAHSRPTDTSPFPVGQVFTQAEWAKVTTELARRGFDRSALRVVSGLRLQAQSKPLALVRASSATQGLCFVPVRGVEPGSPTCSLSGHLEKPLLVFAATDHWGNQTATDVVGVARHSVVGVSITDHRGFPSGVALIPSAGGLWSFAGGYGDSKILVRARLASGRIAAQTTLP